MNLAVCGTPSLGLQESASTGMMSGWTTVELEAHSLVFRQGETARYVFTLLDGVVKLVRNEESRELIVSLRGPGSLLGVLGAVLDERYLFNAETVTPCKLRRIAAADLLGHVKADASAAWYVLSEQLLHMRNDLMHATAQGCLPLRVRLANVLRMLLDAQPGRKDGKPVRLNLPVRHWELAQFLAVTPEHLSRVLKELAVEGVVTRDKGWLLVDPVGLRAIAER